MQWRHLQPLRKKRALAAAAIDILAQRDPAPTPRLPWRERGDGDDKDHQRSPCVQVDVIQILASLLRKCDTPEALQYGKRIHAQAIAAGHSRSSFLGILLVKMYGRCGSPSDAKAVFDDCCENKDISAWNSLFTAFVQNGKNAEAVALYRDLCAPGRNVEPTASTFVQALVACSGSRSLADGKAIHSRAIASGCDAQIGVSTALIDMYGKCGCPEEARRIFDRMEWRTIPTWNAMIAGYAHQGHLEEAVDLYRRMGLEGVGADVCTLSTVLSVCKLADGRQIHQRAAAIGLDTHVVVGTALVRTYGRWGSVEEAELAFHRVVNKDVVCYTALMAVFVGRDFHSRALELYREALDRGVKPDAFVFATVLGACTGLRDLDSGREIHRLAIRGKGDTDLVVATALVAMYGRCKQVEEAKAVFDRMQHRNVVSWNAILAAFAEAGMDAEIVESIEKVEMEVEPDVLVFSKALTACGNLGDIAAGRRVHDQIERRKLGSERTLENGLVSMYSRCGSWRSAKSVFDRAARRDPVSWNAIISATARYSRIETAIDLFREMGAEGVEPNDITFTGILNACAHAGLVSAGVKFLRMVEEFGCELVPDHFHCVIDLFGRLGMMEQAEELINRMPFEPDLVAWTTLVGACKLQRDLDCASRCVEHVAALNMRTSGPFVLLRSMVDDDGESHLN